jgi:hypothetical protein
LLNYNKIRQILDACLQVGNGAVDEQRLSVFIDVLNLLADNSDVSSAIELLMEYNKLPAVSTNVASALICGDWKIIHRALNLTGSVAFSKGRLALTLLNYIIVKTRVTV